jgi:cytochrome c biogenesis protein CcmG, thiol:disulfide interchange protein DsbE
MSEAGSNETEMSEAGLKEVETSTAAPARRRLLTLVPLAAFLALAALFFFRLGAGDPERLPSALIGLTAPQADLPPLEGLLQDGKPVPGLAAGDLRGPVSVVNVFASWCGPCRDEHPVLASLAATGKARLVGINYKDDPENARRFLGRLGNPYSAIGVDTKGRAAIDWGVYGVPETFIVGPDGTIRYKHVGPLSAGVLASVILPEIEKASRAGKTGD